MTSEPFQSISQSSGYSSASHLAVNFPALNCFAFLKLFGLPLLAFDVFFPVELLPGLVVDDAIVALQIVTLP